jgi:hypothetical protein
MRNYKKPAKQLRSMTSFCLYPKVSNLSGLTLRQLTKDRVWNVLWWEWRGDLLRRSATAPDHSESSPEETPDFIARWSDICSGCGEGKNVHGSLVGSLARIDHCGNFTRAFCPFVWSFKDRIRTWLIHLLSCSVSRQFEISISYLFLIREQLRKLAHMMISCFAEGDFTKWWAKPITFDLNLMQFR